MSTANVKRGDTKGIFTDVLTLDDVAVDLTGCSLRFIMRRRGKPAKAVNQVATITTPATGEVSYQPVDEDVDTEGVYEQEWEVTFPSTKILTFPNNAFNTVNILRDLGGVPAA